MKACELARAAPPEVLAPILERVRLDGSPLTEAVIADALRNGEIWRRLRAGQSYAVVAVAHGLSESQVRRIEAQMREAGKIFA